VKPKKSFNKGRKSLACGRYNLKIPHLKKQSRYKAALSNNLDLSNYSSSIMLWLIPTVLKPPST
jgi:hypothetical protein